MNPNKRNPMFMLGNGLLAVSLVLLFFIDVLWARFGVWAMALWMLMAGVGMFLIMGEKRTSDLPD